MRSFIDGHAWLKALPFVILGLVIYSNTFKAPFIFDDLQNIKENPLFQAAGSGTVTRATFESYCTNRPVANFSFFLNYRLHQDSVTGYHVVNVAVHILAGIFLFLLLRTTLTLPCVGFDERHGFWIALFSSLLWFVNPVQTQSVTYIVQRMNSMASMFYVLSLFFYAKGRLVGRPRTGWPWFAGSAAAGILALGTKEIAATLPFFVFLYEWFFLQDLDRAWIKRRLPYLLGAVVVFGVVALLYLGPHPLRSVFAGYGSRDFTPSERVLTEFRVVIYYIGLLLYPRPSRLNLDHDFSISHSLLQPMTTLFSLGAIIGLIVLAILTAKKQRLISFAILWFFGNLAIESSVVNLEIIFEHRTYLPSMFFFVVLVVLAYRLFRKDRLVVWVLSAAVLVLCLWTYERNQVWGSSISLWSDCAKKSPDKLRPHYNLGTNLARASRLEEANLQFRQALRVAPDDTKTHFNLATSLTHQGKLEEAAFHYREAIRTRPLFPEAETGLGVALARQGKLEEAIAHYRRALEVKPDDEVTQNNLGHALARQGKFDEAAEHYRAALRIKPGYTEALRNMKILSAIRDKSAASPPHHRDTAPMGSEKAQACFDEGIELARQGKLHEAVERFRDGLKIGPDSADGHYDLGVALAQQGKLDEAVDHYEKAVRIRPDYAEAHNNLGIVLARQGKLDEAMAHFSKALSIRPGFKEAEKNLMRAKGQVGKL